MVKADGWSGKGVVVAETVEQLSAAFAICSWTISSADSGKRVVNLNSSDGGGVLLCLCQFLGQVLHPADGSGSQAGL